MICWVYRLYFSGLVCSVLSLDECLIKINCRRFCECFRCLRESDLVESFVFGQGRIRQHVYLILLCGMNDLRGLVNMTWSTNVENISSRRNSFGLGSHFWQQNKHIPLKKDDTTDHLQSCQLFLECYVC